MKKLHILLALLCINLLSYSQLRMSILGGPLTASVKEEPSASPGITARPGYSNRSSLNLGILAEVPLSSSGKNRFFLHPGIFYMGKGRKYSHFNDTTNAISSDTVSASHQLAINYVEIPFNLTWKLGNGKLKWLMSAGPYVGFFYNGKQKFQTKLYSSDGIRNDEVNLETGSAEGKIKTIDAGWNIRAGLEIGQVLITGFMSQGLTDFYNASNNTTYTHQVKGVSIGFWLNRAKKEIKTLPVIETLPVTPPAPVEEQPKDSDGDGIGDNADACPDMAGVPEFNGCPVPDSDGDGINDLEDKCPRVAGSAANNGCPELNADTVKRIEEKLTYVASHIMFKPGSDELTDASKTGLNELASVLDRHHGYNVVIEGHTDSTGSIATNRALSLKRAESVKKYLMEQGVPESRLAAKGYGPDRPLAPNQTPEGRARNRRVELKLVR